MRKLERDRMDVVAKILAEKKSSAILTGFTTKLWPNFAAWRDPPGSGRGVPWH
jgi:hypothetical protein